MIKFRILAATEELARMYALDNKLTEKEWLHVYAPKHLKGLDGVTVLVLEGWGLRKCKLQQTKLWIELELFDMRTCNRIIYKKFNDPILPEDEHRAYYDKE